MKKFSGTTECIKCGTINPYSEYVIKVIHTVIHRPEYMKRICRHCKYAWYEYPKDHKEVLNEDK